MEKYPFLQQAVVKKSNETWVPFSCSFSDVLDNHAYGMHTPSSTYDNGYFNPNNAGFWKREVQDAVTAGLQFLLPNVYGHDIYDTTVNTPALVFRGMNVALDAVDGKLKFGMLDDTWYSFFDLMI
jgi:hypothetical protein